MDKELAKSVASDVYGDHLAMLNKVLGDLEEVGYDTESENSYRSNSPVPLDEMENDNLWRTTGALDFGDTEIVHRPRVMFDRRFTHRPRYERKLEEIRRRRREQRGAETVTLFRPVYMESST